MFSWRLGVLHLHRSERVEARDKVVGMLRASEDGCDAPIGDAKPARRIKITVHEKDNKTGLSSGGA